MVSHISFLSHESLTYSGAGFLQRDFLCGDSLDYTNKLILILYKKIIGIYLYKNLHKTLTKHMKSIGNAEGLVRVMYKIDKKLLIIL